jgi:protein associated with RNAse G/E
MEEGRAIMQPDFQVESRSYDQMVRGTWQAYRLGSTMQLGEEESAEVRNDCQRLWVPAGTLMHWSTRTHPLRYNCLQFFWPERWYMLSAFYDDLELKRTYANIIQPPMINLNRVAYIDLDLSILVEPDLTYEVLTQAEFDQLAETLHYDEETRISALMAMRMLTNSIMLGVGLFAMIPQRLRQAEFHLANCYER